MFSFQAMAQKPIKKQSGILPFINRTKWTQENSSDFYHLNERASAVLTKQACLWIPAVFYIIQFQILFNNEVTFCPTKL